MKLKRILAGVLTAAMVITSVPVAGLGSTTAEAADVTRSEDGNSITYTNIDLNDETSYNVTSTADFFTSSSALTNIAFNMVLKYDNGPENKKYALLTLADDAGNYLTIWHNPKTEENKGTIQVDLKNGSNSLRQGWNLQHFFSGNTNYHEFSMAIASDSTTHRMYMTGIKTDGTVGHEGARNDGLANIPVFNTNGWTPTKVYLGKAYSSIGVTPAEGHADLVDFPGTIAYLKVSKNVESLPAEGSMGVSGYTDVQDASTTALQTAVTAANARTEDSYEQDDNWTAFAAARTAAESALTDESKTDVSLWTALDTLKAAQNALVEKEEEDPNTAIETPQLSVAKPVAGETPADMTDGFVPTEASITDGSDNPVTIQKNGDVTINADGSFSGKLFVANDDANASKLNFKNKEKFLIRASLNDQDGSGLRTIIGKMNNQYGIQINDTLAQIYANAKWGDAQSQSWPSVATNVASGTWSDGDWHEIIAVYDGDKFKIAVDSGDFSVAEAYSRNTNISLVENTSDYFTIGYGSTGDAAAENLYYTGLLKDVEIYSGDAVSAEATTVAAAKDALAGKDPVFKVVATPATEAVYTMATTWKDASGNALAEDAAFEDATYTVETVLTAKAGYSFKKTAAPTSLTVAEGETVELTADNVVISADGTTMTITYTFEKKVEDTRTALGVPALSMTKSDEGVAVTGNNKTTGLANEKNATITPTKEGSPITFKKNDEISGFSGDFTVAKDDLDVAGSAPFLFSFKLWLDDLPTGDKDIVKKAAADPNKWQYAVAVKSTAINAYMHIDGNIDGQKWPQDGVPINSASLGKWLNVVVIYQDATSMWKVLVDDTVSSKTDDDRHHDGTGAVPAADTANPAMIFTGDFPGKIADFKMYKGTESITDAVKNATSAEAAANALADAEPVLDLHAEEVEKDYSIATESKTNEDGSETVTATLTVLDQKEYRFTADSKPSQITVDGKAVKDIQVNVADDGNSMTVSYTFAGEVVVSPNKLQIAKTTVPSSTSDTRYGDNGGAAALTDGNLNTIWHTTYAEGDETVDGPRPMIASSNGNLRTLSAHNEVIFELNALSDVTKFRYKPKGSDGSNNGCITKCSIYIAGADGVYTESPVATASWEKNGDWKEVDITPAAAYAKYVKIVATETYCSEEIGYISASEMEVWGTPANTEISKAELTVDAPAYLTAPAETVTVPDGVSYTAGALTWTPAAEKFAADTEYTASVVLTATGDFTFAEGATATVNGEAATVTRGEDGKTLNVSYTFAGVADPTAAQTALKEEIAKPDVPVENKKEDGTQKYTSSTWNTYKTAYDKAKALADLEDLTGKTPKEFEDAKNEFLAAKAALVELGDVTEIELTPDVTVAKPVVGQAVPSGLATLTESSLATDATLILDPDAVIDPETGAIKGRITDAKPNDPNSPFNVTGHEKMVLRLKIKCDKPQTNGKQAIIGKMNDQYGIQLQKDSQGIKIFLYACLSGTQWAEVSYKIPADWNWNEWHEVVGYYDGYGTEEKAGETPPLHLYVDGNQPTDDRGYKGTLVNYSDAVFTIGYNYAPKEDNVTYPAGEDFDGWVNDIRLYTKENVPELNITSDMDAETVKSTLDDALKDAKSSFVLKGTSVDQGDYYEVTETTWNPSAGTVGQYEDYEVTVKLTAKDNYIFANDATAKLRTDAANELEGAGVKVGENGKVMTITYTFKGEEHPRTTLENYLASEAVTSVGTVNAEGQRENKDENDVRVYTVASWNVFAEKLNAANAALAGDELTPEEYTEKLNDLKAAVEALKWAAETCECTLGNITGFDEDITENLETGAELTITLGGAVESYSTDCMKGEHAGATPSLVYAFDGTYDGAELADGVLTVTKAGIYKVKLTVTLGDVTKNETITVTVTSRANEEEWQALQDAITNAEKYDKDQYTADSWAKVEKALDAARDLDKDNATAAEVNSAKDALQEAIAGLKLQADADKEALFDTLGRLIDDATAKKESGLYTVESANALAAVCNEAVKTYNKAIDENNFVHLENVTADELDKAIKDLQAAIDKLVTKEAQAAADLKDAQTTVTTALSDAKKLVDAGQGSYSDATWKAFTDAYAAAQAAAASKDPVAIKKAAAALAAAQKALAQGAAAPAVKAGQKIEMKDGRYQIISVEKKTVRLVKAKAKKTAKMGVAGSISINGVKYTVVEVGAKAFKGIKTLKQITLSKNIKTIGKQAFAGCKKLSKVVVKSTVLKTIKSGAFKGTSKKMTVTFKSKKVKAKTRKALLKKMKKAGMSKYAKLK